MRKLIPLVLCLLSPLYADGVTRTGTTAAGFLSIDVGARAVGMGGAYVSVAGDASTMYWNSAGLARLTELEVQFSHTRWILDVSMNYAAVAIPLGRIGTLGVNAAFLSMEEMERTTVLEPDGTGEMFDAGSYAFGLSYAFSLTDRFSVGCNLKYITETIYNCSAQGVAFDIGTLFTTPLPGLELGMNISNYGTKMRMQGQDVLTQVDIDPSVAGNNPSINAHLATDSYDLPLLFQVGISMDILRKTEKHGLLLAIDAVHPNNDTESLNLGVEYIWNKMIALRGGYKSLFRKDSEEGLSLGLGFSSAIVGTTKLIIDYAYRDFGILKEVQMFTIGMRF
jgi:long-subunit fatty acid transport protein